MFILKSFAFPKQEIDRGKYCLACPKLGTFYEFRLGILT